MESTVGLAVGRGTGPELARVFERTLTALGELFSTSFTITRSPRLYHSYNSLKTLDADQIRSITRDDARHYEEFCRAQAELGVSAVFRTAINAQSLYLVREHLRAVKVDVIESPGATLLLVRDEAQGFYTGENTHSPGAVTRTMAFTEDVTDEVIAFAVRRARQQWPDTGADQVVMAYKFHLLDGALGEWVARSAARHGVRIALGQPDTVNRNLIEHGLSPRMMIIGGNEWADVMHPFLLDRFGSERQENRFTENIHLCPEVRGLVEYQTVHGSADDIEGRDVVNPVATVRAAAAIAERHGSCAGAIAAVERALDSVLTRGTRTPDLGGTHSTTSVVDALLAELGTPTRAGEPVLAAES
ncbi:isocitrate/isopropylmalate family dehydrogenase [Actinokineospora spheciospongiae]|uniref:isocitrate/isopropylmalate family dehydrogenase n=1 Tax=Actinokineospora spheciospongiae TaxID=909613 RepID=UPI000D7173AE|nr:isocitrate/isopropylmalate family dehydrogenase [Actinokineospora spheciospongiae]PWW67066.1 isocitrate/isopropylmalate dehydrogenase [Actinokineospora spheciospongiae]